MPVIIIVSKKKSIAMSNECNNIHIPNHFCLKITDWVIAKMEMLIIPSTV